jgi:hypothetical protein
MWNSLVAGVVFQHGSVAQLRRELLRNGQLRAVCGFEELKEAGGVPGAWAYSRFMKSLLKQEVLVLELFEVLVARLRGVLPDLGQCLAVDGKAISSHARRRAQGKEGEEPDGRQERDADWGAKTIRKQGEDGTIWEKVKRWFGFKLHLVVDTKHELPVAFAVTRASAGEQPVAKALVRHLFERQEELLERCERFLGDKGYDDGELIRQLWDEHGIKPVVAIRNCWNDSDDGQGTRVVSGQTNVIYDYQGTVSCCCPRTGEVREMAYGGFEEKRGTLKYRCPAQHYGAECRGRAKCPISGAIRIKLDEDRRVFTPLARSSYVWEAAYRQRTAVERVNSRLDVSFGFEHHFIRGLKKMKLQVGLALSVMLAMALGRIREKQTEHLRSLVQAA